MRRIAVRIFATIMAVTVLGAAVPFYAAEPLAPVTQNTMGAQAGAPSADSSAVSSIVSSTASSSEVAISSSEVAPSSSSSSSSSSSTGSSSASSISSSLPASSSSSSASSDILGEDLDKEELALAGTAGQRAFLTRLYNGFLGRGAKEVEYEFYFNGFNKEGLTGTAVAANFFLSPEFQGTVLTDDEFITRMYQVTFDRVPSAKEIEYYQIQLASGVSRQYTLACFLNSPEFRTLCTGNLIPWVEYNYGRAPRDRNLNMTAFVKGVYEHVLSRGTAPSAKELDEYCALIQQGQLSGIQMVRNFTQSPEFARRNLGDVDYIQTLYRAFLGRTGAVNTEVAYWMNHLANGMSRDYVFNGFANSPEFIRLCEKSGVPLGSFAVSENRDKSVNITSFVNQLYKGLLGRAGDANGLNAYTGKLLSGATGTVVINEFISSAEFVNRASLGNASRVQDLYRGLFGREADASGLANFTNYLNQGNSVKQLITLLTNEQEYINYCKSHDVAPGKMVTRLTVTATVNGTRQVVTGEADDILSHIVMGEIGGWNGVRDVETYKAQAVAAHSWILYQNRAGNAAPDVAWGDNYSAAIRTAVESVVGEIRTFNGAPALTCYSASAGLGWTNRSEDIWETALPYLVSVPSPDYEYASVIPKYETRYVFTRAQIEAKLNAVYAADVLNTMKSPINYNGLAPSDWLRVSSSRPKGSANKMAVTFKTANGGTKTYAPKAEFIKNKLGLRSSDFKMVYSNGQWVVTSYGYGHGVGMSQWGAHIYAEKYGWNYVAILNHYYPGTVPASAS